jgi:hypothetical protein
VWSVVTGEPRVRAGTAVSWALLLGLAAFHVVDIATYDFRSHPVSGDQSSFLLQAQSLAGPHHHLSFGRDEQARYVALHWEPAPYGLFFQRHGHGWAFAKPYGYSLVAALPVWALGAVHGMALTNAAMLLALLAVSLAILRSRYSGWVVPLVTLSFFLVAQPYFYGYVMDAELFLALLTAVVLALVLWYWKSRRLGVALTAFAGMGFAVTEKPPFLVLVLPIVAVVLWQQPSWRVRTALIATGLIAWGVATVPYVVYSDGATWNPYGGERYYAVTAVPFDGVHLRVNEGWTRAQEDEYFRLDQLGKVVTQPGDRLESLAYYFVGRNTGLLVFLPTGLFLLIAALARARDLDRHAWSLIAGILGYIAFYVLIFPTDYYGGGASLGNRYFLQVAPSLLAAAVLARVSPRVVAAVAIAGGILGLAFLWPQHLDPSGAYAVGLARTSPIQRLLPFESNQTKNAYFRCPPPFTPKCIRVP